MLEKEKLEAKQEESEREQKGQCKYHRKNKDILDKGSMKHVSKLEKEKNMTAAQEAFQMIQRNQCQSDESSIESLENILTNHLSQLEEEKQRASSKGSEILPPRRQQRVKPYKKDLFLQVSNFLSSEFGLGSGDPAVSTNGRVVLHK